MAEEFWHPPYKCFYSLTMAEWKLPLSQTSSLLNILHHKRLAKRCSPEELITSLFHVNIAICNMREIPVLMWYKEQGNISRTRRNFSFWSLCWSKDLWDTFECFSLFGLIHILLDTEKPLCAAVASLMSQCVPPSRWHQPTCQGMHMSDCKRCFLLEGKGSAKDSVKPSNSPPLSLPCARTLCQAARENN